MRKIHVSDAGQEHQRHLPMLLMHTKRDVYANSGYTMTKQIAKQRVRDDIQRRRHKEQLLTARQKHSNKHVAKPRARVGHVFGAMQQMAGKLVRRIGPKRADVAIRIKTSLPYVALSLSARGSHEPVLGVNPSVVREQGSRWLKNHQLRLISYPKCVMLTRFYGPNFHWVKNVINKWVFRGAQNNSCEGI